MKAAYYTYDSLNRPWLVCRTCGKKSPAWGFKKRVKCKYCGTEHSEEEKP